MELMFSILTVTLNPGQRLLQTAASVREQQFSDFEHIIKDGGSTDGSVEQLQAHAAPRLKIIREPDTGIYDAMNQAAAQATGKYLLFLNAGDRLHDAAVLSDLADEIRRHYNPAVIYGDYYSQRHGMVIRSPRLVTPLFLYRTTLCHQAYLVSRDAFVRLCGFDLRLKVRADADLLLRLCLLENVQPVYCPRPISVYEGGGMSESADSAAVALEEANQFRQRYFSARQRMAYQLLRAATLPELRGRILSSRRLTWLRRVVLKTTNAIYRVG